MLNLDNLVKELEIALEGENSVKYKITVKRTKKGKDPAVMVRISNENESAEYNTSEYGSISLLMTDVRQILQAWEIPSFTR